MATSLHEVDGQQEGAPFPAPAASRSTRDCVRAVSGCQKVKMDRKGKGMAKKKGIGIFL